MDRQEREGLQEITLHVQIHDKIVFRYTRAYNKSFNNLVDTLEKATAVVKLVDTRRSPKQSPVIDAIILTRFTHLYRKHNKLHITS